MQTDWTIADRVSDRIVDLVNVELEKMRAVDDVQPLQLFAGQMLAFLAVLRTAPLDIAPASMREVEANVRRCLREMMA